MKSQILDYSTERGSANLKPTHPLVALVLCLIPLMMLALPLPPDRLAEGVQKQNSVLVGAIMVAVGSAVLWRRTRRTLVLLILGTSLLLCSNIAWNKAYRRYNGNHQDYKREVFRPAMRVSLHAPVYGRYDNALARWNPQTLRYDFSTLPFVLLSGLIAAGWYFWARRRAWDAPWTARSLALVMGFQLALIITFALCEPWPSRLSLQISGYSEFKKDIPAFAGVRDTLRHYVERMPNLEWYGQHYPPGNLILLEIEKETGLVGMTKTMVCLCTILSVIPLWRLTRELEFDDVATSATLLLFTAGTGVLVYCTINTTSLLLLPGTMCLWLLVRALKTGSLAAAAWLGVWYVVYLCFSFSASILGVLMALTTIIGLLSGAFRWRNAMITGATALATLGCVIALLFATTHFNLVACFFAAVRGHQAQQGNEGFDDAKRWLLRSTGNLIAYVFSIVPLCVLAVAGERSEKPSAAKALCSALVISVAVAAFSGLFYIETERIWIFLTPTFALAAGWELSRRSQREGSDLLAIVFLLVLLISCSQEWFFMHYR